MTSKFPLSLCLAALLLLACNLRSKKAATVKYDYPADAIQAFMNSCAAPSTGSGTEMCSCILDKIQRKYTYGEFSAINDRLAAGGTDDDFMAFVLQARAQCGGTGTAPEKYDYPADVVQNFMNSCTSGDPNNQQLCSCVLDKIQRKYPFSQFYMIDSVMRNGGSEPGFVDFMNQAKEDCAADK